MNMPTDKEQDDILKWDKEQRNEWIMDKIYKTMSQAEQRILEQISPIQQKVDEHDSFIVGLAKSFSAGFGAITGFTGKATKKS